VLEVCVLVEHLSVELIKLVSAHVQSLQLVNRTNGLEKKLGIDERRTGCKLIAREI
jgi:hypothetical protein